MSPVSLLHRVFASTGESAIKIVISTFGSRGDVEPPLALAVELQARQHQVTVVAPKAYAAWIRANGVGWAELRFDLMALMHGDELQELRRRGHWLAYMRALVAGYRQGSLLLLDDLRLAARDADFVIQTGQGHGGVEIAEERGIPMAFLYLMPMAPTAAFPSFFLTQRRSLGGWYNEWTQRMVYRVMWRTYGPPLNQWRAERLQLPPWTSYAEMLNAREGLAAPNLLAYSPALLPRPEDWSVTHQPTGFFFLNEAVEWQPSAELRAFLEQGPPPVYVGFGSIRARDSVQLTHAVLRALERSGQRGVLLTGGGGGLVRLPAPASVFYIETFAHRWLFPKMAAIVHHGGVGTTAATLRSGVPGVWCPHLIDQHGWAEQVEKRGVGIRASSLQRLRSAPLAAAIARAVGDGALRARAAAFGELIRSENGVGKAADRIERYAVDFARAAKSGRKPSSASAWRAADR